MGIIQTIRSPILRPRYIASSDPYAIPIPKVGDIYISTSGSDVNPGTIGSPKSYSSATMTSAVAGQIIWMRAGTYNAVDVRTLNSGTLGNNIGWAAYPGETVNIVFAGGTPEIGLGGGDYWNVYKLNLQCVDTGFNIGCAGNSGAAAPAHHWNFIDCIGTQSAGAGAQIPGANTGIIKIDPGGPSNPNSDDINWIRGSLTGPSSQTGNYSLIWSEYQHNQKIIGAVINGSANPIYYKHNDAAASNLINITVANNIIGNPGRATSLSVNYVNFTNNVFFGGDVNPAENGGGPDGGQQCLWKNNVFHNSRLIFGFGATTLGNILRDNVFSGSGAVLMDGPFTATDMQTDIDYCLFQPGSNATYRNSVTQTYANYVTLYSKGTHGLTSGSISFAAGSNPSSFIAADWDLTAPSAALTASSIGGKIGVDYTKLLTVN